MKVCCDELTREQLCALLTRAAVDICALQSEVAELRVRVKGLDIEEMRMQHHLLNRSERGADGRYRSLESGKFVPSLPVTQHDPYLQPLEEQRRAS